MKRIVLGLSGGVDSAVSARLLQQEGYEVLGVYLDIGGEREREDAIRAAEFLGLELKILDIRSELEEKVCKPFRAAYMRGETPNPCILCNPAVKFKALCDTADECGIVHVATGHYAKSRDGKLYKGQPENDQSYMLCRLRPEQAQRLILPLGEFPKGEVREMARQMGIPVADKPDSMEICFIPDKDYVAWLSARGELPPSGDFVFHGKVIGRHEGIVRYTVGQRRPGLYEGRKLYISGIDAANNRIELALWEELFKTEVYVRELNWLIEAPAESLRASVRVRHTKWENPACTVEILSGDEALIHCDSPVRAPAPGQAAALYCGEQLVGGGKICSCGGGILPPNQTSL